MTAVGSVIVYGPPTIVQPFASVTVTLYVPAPNVFGSSTLSPLDHAYVYDVVPPVTVISILPFSPPLHVGFTTTAAVVVISRPPEGPVISTLLVVVQLFASVTVTTYVPAARLLATSVV